MQNIAMQIRCSKPMSDSCVRIYLEENGIPPFVLNDFKETKGATN